MSLPKNKRIDAIDFWRGFALLSIFVNHLSDNVFAYITHRNFGFSDAAELFVFLSGISVALAYGRRFLDGQPARAVRGLFSRVLKLYGVQILVSLVGIAILVVAATLFDDEDFTEDADRDVVLERPLRSLVGLLTLMHQFAFFNILPLYIAVMIIAPGLFLLARIDKRLMLAVSAAVYLAVRIFSLHIPTWPLDGEWYFNPFAWQFLFAIGLFFGLGLNKDKLPYDRVLFIVCLLYLAGSLLLITNAFGFVPDLWENIRAHVPHDKTSLSWIRLVHFLALTYAIYYSGLTSLLRTTKVFEPLALMGRHSLPVFATGAFLTLVGEAIMETGIHDFAGQIIVITGGIIIQYWVARYFEARTGVKSKVATAPEPAPVAAPRSVEPQLQTQESATRVAV